MYFPSKLSPWEATLIPIWILELLMETTLRISITIIIPSLNGINVKQEKSILFDHLFSSPALILIDHIQNSNLPSEDGDLLSRMPVENRLQVHLGIFQGEWEKINLHR